MDFRLVPLLKGLRIGAISSQFIEAHDFSLGPADLAQNSSKSTRVVIFDTFQLNEDEDLQILDGSAEGYQFSRTLDLPKTLRRCVQDTTAKGIKIRHKLKFRVQLFNPDGHTSEVFLPNLAHSPIIY